MKKLIITLVFCLAAIAPVFAQNRTVVSFANMREQSNMNSTVIEVIPHGTCVYVLGDVAGGWSLVIYNYKVGYINSSNLASEQKSAYTHATRIRYYTNSAGQRVQSPTYYPYVPQGATARCVDGTYSFSRNRRGTCSHHGGVAQWL